MGPPAITFRYVPGVRVGTGRGVGFLEGHSDLGGSVLFDLCENERKYILASMDMWVAGHNGPARRFHSFPGTPCFVFKHVTAQHRFYGFVCNPMPKTNARFQLCALTTYARKKETETDQADLKRVVEWMKSSFARAAIGVAFPDKPEGNKK